MEALKGNETIMVVDDEEPVRQFYQNFLSNLATMY